MQKTLTWTPEVAQEYAEFYASKLLTSLIVNDKYVLNEFIEMKLKEVSPLTKPTVGFIPNWMWIENRYNEIQEAISKRKESGHSIPDEWYKESVELYSKIQGRKESVSFTANGDNQIIYMGDSYFYIDERFKFYCTSLASTQDIKKGIIQFKDENLAMDYILNNKPCLSLNDSLKLIRGILDSTTGNMNKGYLTRVFTETAKTRITYGNART